MNDIKFNAILAKNEIARAIRDTKGSQKVDITTYRLESLLKDIEEFTGEVNQPSIRGIINDKRGWL